MIPAITATDLHPTSQQVDGEAAESFIAEKRIGERIKYLRLKKSMGLVRAGASHGTFRQLSFATGDGPGGADAAQPGTDCDGLLEGP